MSVEDFIDTNVFIYQLEGGDDGKAAVSERIIGEGIAGGTACISFQVVQECLNTALRKAEIKLSLEDMREYMESVLGPLLVVQSSLALYKAALDVRTRYRFGFYDSLIVAAALEAGCKRLYSEDLQHGQRIGGLTVRNPFENSFRG